MLRSRRRSQQALDAAVEELGQIKTRGLPFLIAFFLLLLYVFTTIIILFWFMKWTYDF